MWPQPAGGTDRQAEARQRRASEMPTVQSGGCRFCRNARLASISCRFCRQPSQRDASDIWSLWVSEGQYGSCRFCRNPRCGCRCRDPGAGCRFCRAFTLHMYPLRPGQDQGTRPPDEAYHVSRANATDKNGQIRSGTGSAWRRTEGVVHCVLYTLSGRYVKRLCVPRGSWAAKRYRMLHRVQHNERSRGQRR